MYYFTIYPLEITFFEMQIYYRPGVICGTICNYDILYANPSLIAEIIEKDSYILALVLAWYYHGQIKHS